MIKKDLRKKMPLSSSQPNVGFELEEKVDEVLNAHSDVLQRGSEHKEKSETFCLSKKDPQFHFFTKKKQKIKSEKQGLHVKKSTKKQSISHTKNRVKTHPTKKVISQKIPSIRNKIFGPSSPLSRRYFTARKPFSKKVQNEGNLSKQLEQEKKPLRKELKEKEQEAKRLAKEYEKKLRLERLEAQRKRKEELLNKRLAEKRAQDEVKEREREAIRAAKEQKEKIRLEQIAIEKQKRDEQRRIIAEAKEKKLKEQRLLREHEEKERLERLEAQRKRKEELLNKRLAEKRAQDEVKEREREAIRAAKEQKEKIRLEQIAIEKQKREELKQKELEQKRFVAEMKQKELDARKQRKKEKTTTDIKSTAEKEIKTFTDINPQVQDELRRQLGEELKKNRLDRQQTQKQIQDIQPNDIQPDAKNEEKPLVFEDAIAQVKPDESTWLDEKIKSEKPEEETLKNLFKKDAKEIFFDDTSLIADLSAKSIFETPHLIQNTPINELEEITSDGHIKNDEIANRLKALTLQQLGYSQNSVEEIDFYSIQEPFAYVEIIRENESLDKRYILIEMGLSEEESRCLKFIKETLEKFSFKTQDFEEKGDLKYLTEKVDSIINEYMLNIDTLSKEKIMYYLEMDAIGLGKLEMLMKDPNIEDISCDGSGISMFLYHRRYGSLKSNIIFNDDDELSAFVVKLAQKCGKHISISEPMLDATMPDGSRIQMTLSTEVTTKGSTFTIRKFSQNPFSPPDLIEFHTMSSEMVSYMWLAVENGINALIAGGTAAGKTSTLNAISLFIPRESKIVSIEETREINLPHPNWIPGVARTGFGEVVGDKVIGEIDLYDLMKAALRQRPEYILVGEIRGKEAYVLFQAMATGHTTYSTVHADSAQSLIHRLEGKPIEIPRIMLQTLDIVCIQVISRVKNKRVRRCKQIIEIIDIDPTTKEILTNEVFRWDPVEDKFLYSGKSYILERIRAEKGIGREEMVAEIKNRTTLLEWMNKNNIRDFKKVATLAARYVDNPTDVMKKIGNA